jgi:hypothetical protein
VPNLGAVAIGALAGLGIGVVGAIPVLAVGADPGSIRGQSILIMLGLVAQFLAGLVAARIAGREPELHGGLGGLASFAIIGVISLTAAEPGVAALAVGGLTALVMGTLGGFLVRARQP